MAGRLLQPWRSASNADAFIRLKGHDPRPLELMASRARLYRVSCTAAVNSTPVANPYERPVGPLYIRYEDLAQPGDTVTQALARLTTPKVVTFPEGRFECSDFESDASKPGYYQAGITLPRMCKGIVGSGRGTLGGSSGTIFTMRAGSSTAVAKGWIPTQGTSSPTQANLIKHYPNDSTLIPGYIPAEGPGKNNTGYVAIYRNFQVVGSEQGHVFHNFQVFNTPGPVLFEDVLLAGHSGDNGAPPGETFGLQVSGVGAHVFHRLEVDGRRTPDGEVFGAAGLTFQNCVGATFDHSYAHHLRAGDFIFYNSYDCWLIDCTSDAVTGVPVDKMLGNGSINLEVFDGIKVIRTLIIGRTGKVHVTASSDQGTLTRDGVTHYAEKGQVEFIDPTFRFGTSTTTVPALIQTWDPYSRGPSTVGVSKYTSADAFLVRKADGTHIPYTWILAGVRYQIT